MSRMKSNLSYTQSNNPFEAEEKLKEAIVGLNKEAASLQADVFDQQNVSQYICDLLGELSMLASKANLVFLTYLIDVAYEEARIQAQDQERAYL
jgi:hypothetical protein